MKNQKGMTVIEFISTLAIAGALTAVAMPEYEVIREKIRELNILEDVNDFYDNLREQNELNRD